MNILLRQSPHMKINWQSSPYKEVKSAAPEGKTSYVTKYASFNLKLVIRNLFFHFYGENNVKSLYKNKLKGTLYDCFMVALVKKFQKIPTLNRLILLINHI